VIEPLDLARRLIDIPSPTGEEGAVGAFLHERLAALGFTVRRQPVAEGRFNLFADAGGRPRVILNSHLDTVPPWFSSREDETHLHGRGACDTKGVIAAMIAAAERLRGAGVRDFALLFVVGEETDSIGAKRANTEFSGIGSEFVIVGEPTESKFARASKGALTAVLRFEGIAAHSAYPHLGDSAIRRMLAAIAGIEAADWGSDAVLGQTTVNVGVVRGGEKPNVIPALAECELMFRTAGGFEALREKLERLAERSGGRITLARGNDPQFMVVPEGAPSTVVAFNTDVPHLGALGKPMLFGPGSILDAHGSREKIAKDELLASIDVYCDTVRALV